MNRLYSRLLVIILLMWPLGYMVFILYEKNYVSDDVAGYVEFFVGIFTLALINILYILWGVGLIITHRGTDLSRRYIFFTVVSCLPLVVMPLIFWVLSSVSLI